MRQAVQRVCITVVGGLFNSTDEEELFGVNNEYAGTVHYVFSVLLNIITGSYCTFEYHHWVPSHYDWN